MIVTCIKDYSVNNGIIIKYCKGDRVNINERQFLSEHYNYKDMMLPKSIFLTTEELREYKIKKICE
jgi:hypothetical protein